MDFKQVEKRFKKLKNQFETGALTDTEFKTQLEKLMVRDEENFWWMIGYETEHWYRHDGKNWIQTDLPNGASLKSSSAPRWITLFWLILGGAVGGAIGGTVAWTISGAVSGIVIAIAFRIERVLIRWVSMLWILLAWAIAGAVSWIIYQAVVYDIGKLIGLVVGGAVGWAIGGFSTAIILRSENALPNWSSVLWTTLAWTIGGTVGWIVGEAVSEDFGDLIGWMIGWTISWLIGGFFTIWQIREGK